MAAFRCPRCGDGGVGPADGGLRCPRGHVTPWRDGYLDARVGAPPDEASRRSEASFGYEWTRFSSPEPEDEVFWRRYLADVDRAALAGRLALDAGCGRGRFAAFTADHVAALVAADASRATEAAAANLSGRPNACVVRADLRSLPFAAGSFGFVTCLGVLHHLADPGAGFAALARLLAPGGLLLVYVYSRPEEPGLRAVALAAAGWLRRVTTRVPPSVLRPVCWPLAAALYAGIVVPGAAGERRGHRRLEALPLATYRGAPLRSLWLDTFDRLSAPLEARYTPDEVEAWFRSAGLTVRAVRTNPRLAGIVALGERPTEGGPTVVL